MAIAYKHIHERVPRPSSRNPAVPRSLDGWVASITEKQRELRPESAAEARRDLEAEVADAALGPPVGSLVSEVAVIDDPSPTESRTAGGPTTVTIPRPAKRRRRRVRTIARHPARDRRDRLRPRGERGRTSSRIASTCLRWRACASTRRAQRARGRGPRSPDRSGQTLEAGGGGRHPRGATGRRHDARAGRARDARPLARPAPGRGADGARRPARRCQGPAPRGRVPRRRRDEGLQRAVRRRPGDPPERPRRRRGAVRERDRPRGQPRPEPGGGPEGGRRDRVGRDGRTAGARVPRHGRGGLLARTCSAVA